MNLDQARDSIGQRVNVQLDEAGGPALIVAVPEHTGHVRVQTLAPDADGHEVAAQVLDLPPTSVDLDQSDAEPPKKAAAKKASK